MDTAIDTRLDTQDQFQRLLERHRGILIKVAGSYSRDVEERADLVQEICMQLWRAWPKYTPSRSFSTWMYRIALNVAISHLRGRSASEHLAVPWDEQLQDTADPLADDPVQAQQVRALHRFIQAQPAMDRALLLLYLDGCSSREIADVLGIGESNVTTKVNRLKQRIRQEL